MKNVCVVTGSRADYGLLRWVIDCIHKSSELNLQVVVTGMHLSPEFGLTYKAIEADGFVPDAKIEMLLSSDTPVGITKSVGLGMIGFADAFDLLKPDIVVLLGDRFEILAVSTAAMIARIPVAHLHGGETTQGAIDEAIRHSITKMAHLHFVSTDDYRDRVIQLGENPQRVFQFGALGIDNLVRLKLLTRKKLQTVLNFRLASRNLLVTFHPVSLEDGTSQVQMNELLEALSKEKDTGLIFTMPNADPQGRVLFKQIEEFCTKHPAAKAFVSLGQLNYLSCMKHVDGVVGNSSSGIIEAPSLKKGSVNIGDRQLGRIRAASVIDCDPNRSSISSALKVLSSESFQSSLASVRNPYGVGGASEAIVQVLKDYKFDDLLKKRFYDVPVTNVKPVMAIK